MYLLYIFDGIFGDVFIYIIYFRNICIELYKNYPAHFFLHQDYHCKQHSKEKVKLELLRDTDMLWMTEKSIGGGICQAIQRYAS